MDLRRFRSFFTHPFPDAGFGVRFGVDDKTFKDPRLHAAVDLRLEWPKNQDPLRHKVVAPMNVTKTVWHRVETNPLSANRNVTWLDMINSDDTLRFRYAHLYPGEMDERAWDKVFPEGVPMPAEQAVGGGLRRGDPIGPAGDAGLSLAAPEGQKPPPGASARHLHLVLLLGPGVYDDVLEEMWGESWMLDSIPSWCATRPKFFDRLKANGWIWANDKVAARKDPLTGRLFYAVDARGIMGW